MFKQLLVSGLLVLLTSFFSPASNAGIDQPADTTDLMKRDTMEMPPHQRLHEIPVVASVSTGIALEQLHPLAISFTKDYESQMGDHLEQAAEKLAPQLLLIEGILEKYELPAGLKYLAIVESQLYSSARSRAGAVGPWQFMPTTARNMGLKVTRYVDERRDLTKSTHAAARYLKSLYAMYNDWLLVIAAYNGGPGNVNSAVRKAGSSDFWTMERFLPAESRKHVKKFIATHFIMAGSADVTVLTKAEAEKWQAELPMITEGYSGEQSTDALTLSRRISGRYNSTILSRHLMMDHTAFLALNPGFDRQIANYGEYDLKLPSDKMELFVARRPEILTESLQLLLQGTTID